MARRRNDKHVLPLVVALFLPLLFLVGAASGVSAAETSDVTTRSFPVAKTKAISFSTKNGAIEVLGHSGNNIEVTIIRRARSFSQGQADKLLERIVPRVVNEGGRLEVKIDLPVFVLGGSTGAEIRALVPSTWEGTLNLKTSNGTINVAGLRGTGSFGTSNGAVTVDGWQGALQVSTSNGRIDVGKLKLTNNSTFRTSNGSISADLAQLTSGLTLRTSNGSIDLSLPSSVKANLDASTSNGTIKYSGPSYEAESAKNTFSTRLNGGGPEIILRTSNGGIAVELLQERAPSVKG